MTFASGILSQTNKLGPDDPEPLKEISSLSGISVDLVVDDFRLILRSALNHTHYLQLKMEIDQLKLELSQLNDPKEAGIRLVDLCDKLLTRSVDDSFKFLNQIEAGTLSNDQIGYLRSQLLASPSLQLNSNKLEEDVAVMKELQKLAVEAREAGIGSEPHELFLSITTTGLDGEQIQDQEIRDLVALISTGDDSKAILSSLSDELPSAFEPIKKVLEAHDTLLDLNSLAIENTSDDICLNPDYDWTD